MARDDDGDVLAVDPRSGHVSTIKVGETLGSIAIGTRDVWVLDQSASAVWRVDPRTDRVLPAIPFTGSADAIAIGDGFVWVLDSQVGTVTPIDEASGDVRPSISVGTGASGVAVGDDAVWVARGGDVLEINPASFTVTRTIHVGERPIATLAVDEAGDLWLDMARAG